MAAWVGQTGEDGTRGVGKTTSLACCQEARPRVCHHTAPWLLAWWGSQAVVAVAAHSARAVLPWLGRHCGGRVARLLWQLLSTAATRLDCGWRLGSQPRQAALPRRGSRQAGSRAAAQ